MDLALELIAAIVVGVLVLVAGGVALLRGGRRARPPLVDEELQIELEQRAPEAPPPVPGPPEDLEGVEAPQPVDLADPELAAPTEPLPAPPGAPPEPEEEQLSTAERFRRRLGRSRASLGATMAGIFRRGLDEEAWEELEESLIAADVGVEATMELVEGLRDRVRAENIRTGEGALALLKEVLRLELGVADRRLHWRDEGTTVWLITGVNGTGKTTSIGKIAARVARDGRAVVLAAADTFRAAAAEQLQTWGERAGARVVRAGEGADPASVAFDGYQAAKAARADLLLIDTAGRLQNKTELMDELAKVKRVVERDAGPLDEVLLVLDATTGQNGLTQARAFMDAVDVTGVILTKLDGTSKGGIVIAIQRQLGIPVKLVGLGESIDDLAEFDPDAFVDALFGAGDGAAGSGNGGATALGDR